jgi:outer membrane protein TolC
MNGHRTRQSCRPGLWIFLSVFIGLFITGIQGHAAENGSDLGYLAIQSRADSLTLIDAVTLAVDHDPSIYVSRYRAIEASGRLMQSSGVFESSIRFNTSYDLESDPLTDGERGLEDAKRTILRFLAIEFQRAADQLRNQLEEEGLAFPDCPEGLEGVEINAEGDSSASFIENLCMDPRERAEQELFYGIADLIDPDGLGEQLRETNRDVMEALADTLDFLALRSRQTLRRWGPTPRYSDVKTFVFDLSVVKAMRNGLVFTPSIRLQGVKDNWRGKRTDTDWGGKSKGDTFRSTVGVSLDVPLGKGWGSGSTGAAEKASRANYTAAMNDYVHSISETILRTSTAYWQVVGAQDQLALYEESAATTRQLLEISERLRRGRSISEADLIQNRARLAEAEAQVLTGRRALFEARLGLASAMGLVVEGIGSVPSAAGTWPEGPDSVALAALRTESLARLALSRRGDLEAMRNRLKSAQILGKAAKADMKRRKDLTLSVSYRGLHEGGDVTDAKLALEGFQKALFDYSPGPSFKIGFSFDWPFKNNVARGQYVQARSMEHQSQINARNLERVTLAKLEDLIGSIIALTNELEAHEESVENYREVLESEISRYRNGVSSMVEVLQTEEQKISAELTLVSVKQSLASLLSQLRFELGVLLDYRIEDNEVVVESIEPLGYTFGT